MPTALRTSALALALLVGCRADRGSATPGDGAPLRLLAAADAMDGWTCKLEISSRFHLGPMKSTENVTEVELELLPTPDRGLALALREISSRFVGPNTLSTITVDHERVVRSTPERREVLRKSNDAEARALIDALLGEPHAFVAYDEHVRLTDFRSDFGELDEQLPILDSLDLAWAFLYPHLPGKIAVGQRWHGARAFPAPRAGVGPLMPAELRYTLRSVRNDVATIEISGGDEEGTSEMSFSYDVAGSARVRASDGALVSARAESVTVFTLRDVAMGYSSRFVTECRPPKS